MAQLINCPNCGAYRLRELVSSAGCDYCEGRKHEEQMGHLRTELHAQVANYRAVKVRQANAPPDKAKYR